MSELQEIIRTFIWFLATLFLYFLIGFGPGVITGMLLANRVFGRGKPHLYKKHQENIKLAAQHNAQWNPSHQRWRQ